MADLRALGFTARQIGRRVEAGRLHRLYRGVYAVGHTSLTHLRAAVHYGFCDPLDRVIDVTIEGGHTRMHPGIRVHRTISVDAVNHRGVRTTLPLRTLHDSALDTSDRHPRRLVRRAQALHRVSVRQLATSSRLAAIAATGPAPTRSELEDIILDTLIASPFEHRDVNLALHVNGRKFVPRLPLARPAPDSRSPRRAGSSAWTGARRWPISRGCSGGSSRRVLHGVEAAARLHRAGAPTLTRP